jgi:hypothetical protein
MNRGNLVYVVRSVALLAALVLTLPRSAYADRLGLDLIGMFPKDLGEFAYTDLKKARSEKWFAALETQLLPDQLVQIQKFLVSTGINPDRQVDEVAWGFIPASTRPASDHGSSATATTGEQIVGLALGQYAPESSEANLKQKKVSTFESHGYTLFAMQFSTGPNDFFLTYLDSNTMAFGQRAALEKMLNVRSGAGGGLADNHELYSLVNEANGTGAFWAVLNSAYSKITVTQLAPEIGQIAQSSKVMDRVRNLVLRVEADSGMSGQFQVILRSTDDANAFGSLLQAALLYEHYKAGKDNTTFTSALDRAQVFPMGDRVTLRVSLDEDEISSLVNDRGPVNP